MHFSVRFDEATRMIQVTPLGRETEEWCRTSRAPEILESVFAAHRDERVMQDPPSGAPPPPRGYTTPSFLAAEMAARLRLEYPNAEIEVMATQTGGADSNG